MLASALSDVLIVAAIALGFEDLRPWIISLFSVGNLVLIGIIGLSSHLQSEDTQEDVPVRAPSAEDKDIWRRVQTYMHDQRPYLDPDLTLARLSRKLGIPAKTLSVLINQETEGKVSRYVNDARIAAAKTSLLTGETVTTAMLASGFNGSALERARCCPHATRLVTFPAMRPTPRKLLAWTVISSAIWKYCEDDIFLRVLIASPLCVSWAKSNRLCHSRMSLSL